MIERKSQHATTTRIDRIMDVRIVACGRERFEEGGGLGPTRASDAAPNLRVTRGAVVVVTLRRPEAIVREAPAVLVRVSDRLVLTSNAC